MKGRGRRSIRQAQRAGVTVVPFDNPAAYCRMHEETFARHGRAAPHPRRFFQAIFDRLTAHDIAWMAAARYEDVVVSAGIFLHDDQETLYVSGASSSDRRPLSAGHLLHWHIIQQAASQGHAWYDLVGRGVPSIDHFKESFNPDIVAYCSVSWATRPLRLAESAVALGGSFVARAPHIKHRV
jgi:lipid II:glycine glycyltransferase (peptidoglycan interpeptide bridge formation enzyme)